MSTDNYKFLQSIVGKSDFAVSCGCTGPRPGEPVCPCMMRDVRIIDGRYVRITDLGPASLEKQLGKMAMAALKPAIKASEAWSD